MMLRTDRQDAQLEAAAMVAPCVSTKGAENSDALCSRRDSNDDSGSHRGRRPRSVALH